jgi:hypothetical protein
MSDILDLRSGQWVLCKLSGKAYPVLWIDTYTGRAVNTAHVLDPGGNEIIIPLDDNTELFQIYASAFKHTRRTWRERRYMQARDTFLKVWRFNQRVQEGIRRQKKRDKDRNIFGASYGRQKRRVV